METFCLHELCTFICLGTSNGALKDFKVEETLLETHPRAVITEFVILLSLKRSITILIHDQIFRI